MPRFTQTHAEVVHIAHINDEMPLESIVEVRLQNRIGIVGLVRGHHVGNNAGEGGWKYYGSITVQLLNGDLHEIDYLDIEKVVGRWDEYHEAFEKAGLITIVDLPTEKEAGSSSSQ